MRARGAAFAERADLLIRPDLEGWGFEDYSDPEALIRIGREAARRALPRLREMAPGRAVPRSSSAEPPGATVVEVEVRGNGHVSTRSVQAAFGLRPPVPLRVDSLVRGLDRVWATGLFETAWLDLESGPAGLKAVLDVSERPRMSAELGSTTTRPTRSAASYACGAATPSVTASGSTSRSSAGSARPGRAPRGWATPSGAGRSVISWAERSSRSIRSSTTMRSPSAAPTSRGGSRGAGRR